MNFNPRSREGSDRAASSNKEKRYQISIHAPARGATPLFNLLCSVIMISIHAPARGATSIRPSHPNRNIFQSTLPRGERQMFIRPSLIYILISIHAPARGATVITSASFTMEIISIHAPARGATPLGGVVVFRKIFQSTLPRGERRECSSKSVSRHCISIHAPARGATSILSKIHPMFLTISHNASSFSSFPFHSFLPHLLNSSTFCALFQVRISRAFSVYYRFAPKKSTPDL